MSLDVVQRVKSDLVARGINLSGDCGAFEITKRVAWELRGQGFGLLDKQAGSNCSGYAKDIVMRADGQLFDILIDAGGTNGPSWQESDKVSPTRFRPPFGPIDIVTPPIEPPVIPPVDPGIDVIALLTEINDRLAALLAQKPQELPKIVFPTYRTRIFGANVVLTPDQPPLTIAEQMQKAGWSGAVTEEDVF